MDKFKEENLHRQYEILNIIMDNIENLEKGDPERKIYKDEYKRRAPHLKDEKKKLQDYFYSKRKEGYYSLDEFKDIYPKIGETIWYKEELPMPNTKSSPNPLTKSQKTSLLKQIPTLTYNEGEIKKLVDDIRNDKIKLKSEFPKPSGKGKAVEIEFVNDKKTKTPPKPKPEPEPESESEEEDEEEDEEEAQSPKKIINSKIKFKYVKSGNLDTESKKKLLSFVDGLSKYDKKILTKVKTKIRKNEIRNDEELTTALKTTEEAHKKKHPIKLWFGIQDPPAGYRRATMTEAVEAGKVNYYGLVKVDKKTIENKKSQKMTRAEYGKIMAEMAGIRGRIGRIDRDIKQSKDEERQELINKFKDEREQLIKKIFALNEDKKKYEAQQAK